MTKESRLSESCVVALEKATYCHDRSFTLTVVRVCTSLVPRLSRVGREMKRVTGGVVSFPAIFHSHLPSGGPATWKTRQNDNLPFYIDRPHQMGKFTRSLETKRPVRFRRWGSTWATWLQGAKA